MGTNSVNGVTSNMSQDSHQSNPNAMATRWLTEEVFKLIEIVKQNEAIYNQRHKNYFCRPYVENFWREVDRVLSKNPGASLAKWTNLRISFRREYTNYLDEKVPPCWTYFDSMFFLHPYLRKKNQQPPKSLDSQVQNALAQLSDLSSRFERAQSLTYSSSNTTPPACSPEDNPAAEHFVQYFDEPEDQDHTQSDFVDLTEDEREIKPYAGVDCGDIKSESVEQHTDLHEVQTGSANVHHNDVYFSGSGSGNYDDKSQRIQRRCTNYSTHSRSVLDDKNERLPRTESVHVNLPTVASSSQVEPNVPLLRATANVEPISVCLPNRQTSVRLDKPGGTRNSNVCSISSQGTRADICDCKTDPDALFLMSLLPDIQKLNGRDRGKIKIAFQNILQDYLYPD